MKCPTCRSEMVAKVVETYQYRESGLDNVRLHMVKVNECPQGHDPVVSLPRIEDLHQILTRMIASKRGRITGPEIRYLRKHLGWSATDFAKTIGVDPATVSRWEHGHEQIGAQADRALRMMAMHGRPVDEYPLSVLADVAQAGVEDGPFDLAISKSGWKTAA